jgi:PAS domain S-box-containing protein
MDDAHHDDESVTGASHAVCDREVLDCLPSAVIVTDPSGRVVLWNRRAEALYGWAEHEVLGRSIIDLLAPPDARPKNEADFATVRHGSALSGDRFVVRRDGEILRIHSHTQPITDPSGNVVAIVGASDDVGAARAAEQTARDIFEHFRASLVAGGLGTWRWDLATGVTVWDERLEELFGLPPGGFDGTYDTYVSMLHPDDRASVIATVDEAVRTKSRYRTEHRVVWPDGTTHWISGVGGVTLDDRGRVTGTVGCALDITEQVLEGEERQRLAAAISEAHDRERLQRQRLEFLAAVNDELNNSTNRLEVMRNVTRVAVPHLGDWCSIHVLPSRNSSIPDVEVAHVDPTMVAYARELQQRFPYDPSADKGVPAVIRTGRTEFFPDITDDVLALLDATDEQRAIVEQLALRSSIAVPLIKQGRVLGAIQFVMSSSSRRYTADDVALAHTVAGRIASSLENHRLHEEQSDIARTLQHSLLPATLPTIPGVDVAVRYWAAGDANEVGGDFYDAFALDSPNQWAIVVGDVCGTGPAAAALTGLARHTIRASAWHGDTPVQVLTTLNRAVQRSDTNSFLTAVFAVITIDGPNTQMTLAAGGHPLPVLVKDGVASHIGTPGTLLGMFDEIRVESVTESLREGDVIVFYTDGVTDVPRHSLDESRWREMVAAAAGHCTDAQTIADHLREALDRVLPFDRRNDDTALLIIRLDRVA